MFLPLYDRNPLRHVRFHYVTFGICVLTFAVFAIFQSGLLWFDEREIALAYGLIPAVIFDQAALPVHLARVPEEGTLVTYALLHASWLHLLGNLLFLWVFGDNVEDAMGHVRFVIFYVLCAAAAALTHALMAPDSTTPLVGASGAVAGIIGAYLMLHPRVTVWCLVLMRIPLPIPAWIVLGVWIGMQVINAFSAGADDAVAWWAHIGGFVAGVLLILVMRRRGVLLFDRGLATR